MTQYLNTNTNTINFPNTNTIANTLVRTVFKYKYKYFPQYLNTLIQYQRYSLLLLLTLLLLRLNCQAGACQVYVLYSGFCLQGPNLCDRIVQTVTGSKILILEPNYSCIFQGIFISAHCTCHSSVVVICLSYVSVQVLQKSGHFCFTA